MKQLQSFHLKHVTKVFRQNLCFLQGSQARFPAHVYLTLDTSSGVYMRCSWFLMCRITIHESHQIHERSIGLIRILHQNRRVLRMASLSSLYRIYFENHPGARLYNKHSKPFTTNTTPQKGYRVLSEMKGTRMLVKHEQAQFHATIQCVKSPQQML